MRRGSRGAWSAAIALSLAGSGALGDGGAARPASKGPATPATATRLSELEEKIVAADYAADLDALPRLADEAAVLATDPEWGWLARYWSGFASWRAALNGASRGMSQDAMRGHLERAAAELEASLAARPDFADAYAASGSVHGWLGRFHADDPRKLARDTVLYFMRTREALRLEPDNPRVLWVDASIDLFLPAQVGGDPARAIATYRRMLEVSEKAPVPGPLPDWGRPEAYMSLAFAHSNQDPPDLDAALAEARAALELRPDWYYVREVLLPKIETARATAGPAEPLH